MSKPLLNCQQICKSYHDGAQSVQVLSGVDLQINAGELVAILGSSGSGKSTLLQIMGTLDEPDSGKVYFQDQDLVQLSAKEQANFRNKHLGFVYQFHHLLPEFTAAENVAMPKMIGGTKKQQALDEAKELLSQVKLEHRTEHRPYQLSGGERQRVAIARALINRPSIIMADEPTGNLDADTSESIFELIKSINDSFGTTFIVVTHDQGLAGQMHRTLHLRNGNFNAK
ncbi:lipoprotein-releasing ABC transporter ATP-binding protein LolD [Glaciecola sp. 1036]|uniref:lipoprotein-releasing ABC transporter ATP-binding protein LolD n=1 Tax=Alteromonadaceae TaxID=72275 RepID=UPI003D02F9F5